MALVAPYYRISDKKEDIRNQYAAFEKWRLANGHTLFRVYEEIVSVSKNLPDSKRPAYTQMMADVQLHKFEILWVVDTDRLTRESGIDNSIIIRTIGRAGVKVYSEVQGWKEAESGVGQIINVVEGVNAQQYSQKISEKTKLAHTRIKDTIKRQGYYDTPEGKRIYSLGRPRFRLKNNPDGTPRYLTQQELDKIWELRSYGGIHYIANSVRISNRVVAEILKENIHNIKY